MSNFGYRTLPLRECLSEAGTVVEQFGKQRVLPAGRQIERVLAV